MQRSSSSGVAIRLVVVAFGVCAAQPSPARADASAAPSNAAPTGRQSSATPSADSTTPQWHLRLELSGSVVGLALVGAGTALVALNHKGTCDLVPPQTQCPMDYATLDYGIALTTVGAVLTGVSIAALIYERAVLRHAPKRFALMPAGDRRSVGVAAIGFF